MNLHLVMRTDKNTGKGKVGSVLCGTIEGVNTNIYIIIYFFKFIFINGLA